MFCFALMVFIICKSSDMSLSRILHASLAGTASSNSASRFCRREDHGNDDMVLTGIIGSERLSASTWGFSLTVSRWNGLDDGES